MLLLCRQITQAPYGQSTHHGCTLHTSHCITSGEGPNQATIATPPIHNFRYTLRCRQSTNKPITHIPSACGSSFPTACLRNCVYYRLKLYTNKRIDTSFCTVVLSYYEGQLIVIRTINVYSKLSQHSHWGPVPPHAGGSCENIGNDSNTKYQILQVLHQSVKSVIWGSRSGDYNNYGIRGHEPFSVTEIYERSS
jgi:hypothetical protein